MLAKKATFLRKDLARKPKSYTFASAFENKRNLKQNEIEKCSRKRIKKEFFEKIYIRQK